MEDIKREREKKIEDSYTIDELSEILGLAKKTIYKYQYERFDVFKYKGRNRYTKESVRKYMKDKGLI